MVMPADRRSVQGRRLADDRLLVLVIGAEVVIRFHVVHQRLAAVHAADDALRRRVQADQRRFQVPDQAGILAGSGRRALLLRLPGQFTIPRLYAFFLHAHRPINLKRTRETVYSAPV